MVDEYWLERIKQYLSNDSSLIADEYEDYLADTNKQEKKNNGQYYTPEDVCVWMAKKFKEIWDGQKIIDPCCGCGNLIVEVIKQLNLSWEEVKEKIVLFDIDDTALTIAKAIIGKSLGITDFNEIRQIKSYNEDFLLNIAKHDFNNFMIIANPPYGKCDTKLYEQIYETSSIKNWYPLFLEAFAKYAEGYVAVVPQSFLGSNKYNILRQILSDNSGGNIWAFDNVPSGIFYGRKKGIFNTNSSNSVRAAIIQADANKQHGFHISPLIRWKSEERQELFCYADNQLSSILWKNKTSWGKIPKELEKFYQNYMIKNDIKPFKIVKNLISDNGQYNLYIPSTPRYFTSASCRKLNRSQQIELHFNNKQDRDAVYLLLVSSFAYAWWRFFDGEITFTKTMLLNMPVPIQVIQNSHLAQSIQEQEEEYIVYKMNAGKKNENIKFPKKLIAYLNNILFNESELIHLHRNSLTKEELIDII